MTDGNRSSLERAIAIANELLQAARRPYEAELAAHEALLARRCQELHTASRSMHFAREISELCHKNLKAALSGKRHLRKPARDLCEQADKELEQSSLKLRNCLDLWRDAQEELNMCRQPIMNYLELIAHLNGISDQPTLMDSKSYADPN